MDTRLIEATVVSYFQDKHWARLIYLFGSHAQGTATETSDIDVAYWADPPAPALHRFEIWAHLATRLDTDTLDVVDLSRAPLLLRYEVAAEGKPLLVRSEAERIEFEG